MVVWTIYTDLFCSAFFHSRHVLGVKDIYCAFDYGLFYVPKHSFIVSLFLHVVNRLYILSSAFCCWSVVHRESATRFKNICCHFGLLIPIVPDGSQHNFCDKIKFVFLFVKLKMYCPLYEFPLNAVLIITIWLQELVWILHPQRMTF